MGDRSESRPEKSRDWELGEATSPAHPPCAFCSNMVDLADRSICPQCHVVYHEDCWKTNERRCAVYGCGSGGSRKGNRPCFVRAVLTIGTVVSIVSILAALADSISFCAHRSAATTSCMNNLSQMWKMQCVYASQFGGPMKEMSDETGREFWLALTTTQPPLVDMSVNDIFLCPVKGDSPDGSIDYRGPVRSVRHLSDDDPVGSDEPGNHDQGEGGNLLRKNGDVLEIRGAEWSKLQSQLRP